MRDSFETDEARLRVQVELHAGLDLDAAASFRSTVTNGSRSRFHKPCRPIADPSIRRAEHVRGCWYVSYGCSRTHRKAMGLLRALLS